MTKQPTECRLMSFLDVKMSIVGKALNHLKVTVLCQSWLCPMAVIIVSRCDYEAPVFCRVSSSCTPLFCNAYKSITALFCFTKKFALTICLCTCVWIIN